jgi:hypothetical protein
LKIGIGFWILFHTEVKVCKRILNIKKLKVKLMVCLK